MIFDMDYLYIFFSKNKKSLHDRLYSMFRLKEYSHVGFILWSFDKAVESTRDRGVEVNSIYNYANNVPIFKIDIKTIKKFSDAEYNMRLRNFITMIEKEIDFKMWGQANKSCCEFVHDVIMKNFDIDLNQMEKNLNPDIIKNSRYLDYVRTINLKIIV